MTQKIKFSFITLFPDLIRHYLSDALLAKANSKGLLDFEIINLRDFATNKYKSVDDKPFGGGDGVVFEAEPLKKALSSVSNIENGDQSTIIYLSPQGKKMDQQLVHDLSQKKHIVFVCGRYGGVDQRFIESSVDMEVSIGDYILSGGELAALVVTEAVSRLVPGVLGDFNSTTQDSFDSSLSGLLEAPQFTRPEVWNDISVPSILTSGHHGHIQQWKHSVSVLITLQKRPDLLQANHKKVDWPLIYKFYNEMSLVDKKTLGIEALGEKIFEQISLSAKK